MLKRLFFVLLLFPVTNVQAAGFYLSSNDVQGQISKPQEFNSFGCNGDNTSPQLKWSNPPAGTKSFAVTVYDPDAPTGSGWWHWTVFNIDNKVTELKTGASGTNKMPVGSIESLTSYGAPGFGGACPPKGDKPHRYIFTVHALDIEKLDQTAAAQPELVGYFINSHSLAKASIMAYYSR